MPFKSFICEVTGSSVTAEACLDCAQSGAPGCDIGSPAIIAGILRRQRPPDFALAAASQERRDLNLDYGFSVTELLACARKTRLKRQYYWEQKPSQQYWAYRGNLFHSEAERYGAENVLALGEARLFWFLRLQGKVIGLSGQPDLLLFDQKTNGWTVVDYKTIKEVPNFTFRYICPHTEEVIYETPFKVRGKTANCPWCREKHPLETVQVVQLPPQPRGSHVTQIQFYALLVEKNSAGIARAVNARMKAAGFLPEVAENAPVTGAELVYLDMSAQKRIPVGILPREARLALLRERLSLHIQDELPGILTHPHDLWQCDYCPVRAICSELYGGPVGRDAGSISPEGEAKKDPATSEAQPPAMQDPPRKNGRTPEKILAELGY